MPVEKRDLLSVTRGCLVHQVNCGGVMGAGLALQVRLAWPRVFAAYDRACNLSCTAGLGLIQPVRVDEAGDLWVVNLFGQKTYGRTGRHTDYDAHKTAWPKIKKWAAGKVLPVYAPWKIGCNLGGGDWKVMRLLVEALCPEVIWCQL